MSIEREQREQIEQIEELVRQWAGPLPEVDWDALRMRISAAARHEAGIAATGAEAAGA